MSERDEFAGTLEEEVRLDRLLGRWADRMALSPARAEAIRAAVLEAPEVVAELDIEWWQGFFRRMSAVMEGSRRSAQAGATAVEAVRPFLRVGAGMAGASDYRPYLRLT